MREDSFTPVSKSLLVPAFRSADMDGFQAQFAGDVDEKNALKWWHRNMAKTHYGLQGWRRHKVYPDFVFGMTTEGSVSRVVLMETKGLHLAGSSDTNYKQALLARLSAAFADERAIRVGELELAGASSPLVSCHLIFERAWRGELDQRYFSAAIGP